MDLATMAKIIKTMEPQIQERNKFMNTVENYYLNKNDYSQRVNEKDEIDEDDPFRNADNRVSNGFHQILVNQKASYLMTDPPVFDIKDGDKDNTETNGHIETILGDHYAATVKNLSIAAANFGQAWVHYWTEPQANGEIFFQYAAIDPRQIYAIYDTRLLRSLVAVVRNYESLDMETGDTYTIYEYWNATEVYYFRKLKTQGDKVIVDAELETFRNVPIIDGNLNTVTGYADHATHDRGAVPFIELKNNPYAQSDLNMYKGLVDTYDKIYNGFANDLEDVQQVILVLKNYGGEKLKEFMHKLKENKAIGTTSTGMPGSEGGVDKLTIDIPTEARTKMLEITRELIFMEGQGVDPNKEIGTNNSGEALKHMYSLLELKASMQETEFRTGLGALVRAILQFKGLENTGRITQTWHRTKINNESEIADIINKLSSVTSQENITRNNPLVEDPEKELLYLGKDDFDLDQEAKAKLKKVTEGDETTEDLEKDE